MEALREIDANSKVVGKGIIGGLYPLLEQIQKRIKSEGEALTTLERQHLLTVYTNLAGQLDKLWGSISAENSLAVVVPKKLSDRTDVAPVPLTLSTYVGPQEKHCLYVPQDLKDALSLEEDHAIQMIMSVNSSSVERAVDSLTENMEKFREKCDRRREGRSGGGGGFGKKRRRE